MNGTRKYHGHKFTAECPIKDCKYTSRIPNNESVLTNKISSHSKLCPKHRVELIRQRLPLKNRKVKYRLKQWTFRNFTRIV